MFRAKALPLELLAFEDKGPSLETSKFLLYFSSSCIPTIEKTCSYLIMLK